MGAGSRLRTYSKSDIGVNLTTGGLSCQPLAVRGINQNRFVDRKKFTPRQILRQNVQALMDSGIGPTSQSALHKKCGVAQATIGRILRPEGENPKIENVAAIAKAYGLEAWQLLIAGMNPKNPPVLAPISQAERELWAKLRAVYEEVGKSDSK